MELDRDPDSSPQFDYIPISVLDVIGQAILIVDEKGYIIFANQIARDLFEQSDAALQGEEIGKIIAKPAIMPLLREQSSKFSSKGYFAEDFLCNFANSSESWQRLFIFTLPNTHGTLYCLVVRQNYGLGWQLTQINHIISQVEQISIDAPDIEDHFDEIAKLFIPDFADACAFHLLSEEETPICVAFAPADMAQKQALYSWIENDLPNDESDGIPAVLQTRKPVLISEVNPVRRAANAGIKSYMIIPLVPRHQPIGTITLLSSEPTKHYTQNDLSIVENFVHFLDKILSNSQLVRENLQLRVDAEQQHGKGNDELHDAEEQLKQSQEINQNLFRISNKLNATLDLRIILDTLAQEAIQMVDGESGFSGLRTVRGMEVNKYFQQGEEIPFEHVWAFGEGIPGWVLKYKVPYGTSDAENDPLINHDLSINANVRSIICTPILDSTGEVIAYFDIRNKQGAEGFSINDQEMLLTLAPVASIAIQNALTYQQRLATVAELEASTRQLEELAASIENAREEERTHIARELHDQLGQELAAIKFDLTSLSEETSHIDENLAQKTKDIIAQVNILIKMVRQIATELRPGMLDDLGLVASLEWQAKDFEKRSGVRCKLNLPEENIDIPMEQSLAIYRIFQEALTNVSLHASANQIDISLAKNEDKVVLELHDDGTGISEKDITGSHSLGLLGMRERTRHLGGFFEIHGSPGQGTIIKVTIPIVNH